MKKTMRVLISMCLMVVIMAMAFLPVSAASCSTCGTGAWDSCGSYVQKVLTGVSCGSYPGNCWVYVTLYNTQRRCNLGHSSNVGNHEHEYSHTCGFYSRVCPY